MTQAMIETTKTATILPLLFEGWKALAGGGAVELPKKVTMKTHISVLTLIYKVMVESAYE